MLLRITMTVCLLALATGCETLGLSLYPEGELLTQEAQEVLDNAPGRANLPRELNQTVLDTHYLQPGDTLLLEPVDVQTDVRFPPDQQVLVDGTVDLGGYGRVVVAGLSLENAEQLIEETIARETGDKTQVNVRLLEPVHRYYILGAVASPGAYPLTGNENVLDGILEAGGLTPDAAPCKILLARPTHPGSCRAVLPICYREITQLGDTTTNYQLRPGDRVFVSSRTCLDELMFWRADRACPRCSGRQVPCCNPEVIDYENPIKSLPRTWVGLSDETLSPPAAVAVPEDVPPPAVPRVTPRLDGQLDFDEPIPGVDVTQ